MKLETFIREQKELNDDEWQRITRALAQLETKPSNALMPLRLGSKNFIISKGRNGFQIEKNTSQGPLGVRKRKD